MGLLTYKSWNPHSKKIFKIGVTTGLVTGKNLPQRLNWGINSFPIPFWEIFAHVFDFILDHSDKVNP